MTKLHIHSYLLFIILLYLIYDAFQKYDQKNVVRAKEVYAQRLIIQDSLGRYFIAMSDPAHQVSPMMDGKKLGLVEKKRDTPGILFFNRQGDEVGGILFDADSSSSFQLLSFDQQKNDQVMTLRREEERVQGIWQRQYGLKIQERSDKPLAQFVKELEMILDIPDSTNRNETLTEFFRQDENQAPERAFFGRTFDGNVGLFLFDKQHRLRFKLFVNPAGDLVMEKIDSSGNAISLLPPA